MGDNNVTISQSSGVGLVPPDLAADLSTLDDFEDDLAKTRPDLAKPTDAFTDRLQQGVLRGDPIDVAAATDATQDLIALIEQNGIKIPKNASFDDLKGLASQIDDHAAKDQFLDALDKLDAALGGNANLESKAVDLLTASADSKVQGMDANGAQKPAMDPHGGDKQGMKVEDTMLGLTAQDILSMPPDVQMQILNQLSTSDLLIVATALKDKLDQIANSDGPINEHELRDLLAFAHAVKDRIESASGGMMDAGGAGDDGMMDAGGSGGIGRDLINDGVTDDAVQDRKGDADVKGSGDAKSGGGGGKATIRGIAEALGRAIDDAYEALQAKADALGDDPSPSDAIDLQADSAVASALYKAAVEVINAVGKNINDGVRTRQ
ncbi:MAG: hypothetical protein ACR2P1_15915 [Pseudomonadales bacterium]